MADHLLPQGHQNLASIQPKVGWLGCSPLAAAFIHWADVDDLPTSSGPPHLCQPSGQRTLGNQETLAYSSRADFHSSASLRVTKIHRQLLQNPRAFESQQ